ncbi:Aste57867_14961 [Aphanomyces stellatus]|uniref:Aste57867_14961 protein n=1 Tax=Aphanomyces stellatus TaxID=120398 RepID=A0A485L2A4_9STRA|nr:hypothetical protein As57867_014905 [Aphanomyces stellatus]VFT91775.1 Aste57867_14961 [Aphanomyces stellatus]
MQNQPPMFQPQEKTQAVYAVPYQQQAQQQYSTPYALPSAPVASYNPSYPYGTAAPPLPPQHAAPEEENCVWYAITSPLRPTTYLLLVSTVINLAFSTIAFALVVALGSVGAGLLPLCCLGLLVWQLLLYVIHFLAHIDARLYNCTAPAVDQITVNFDVPRQGLYHYSGFRISPDLSNFSKESLLAVFYFVAVKFPLAVLSSISTLVVLATSLVLLTFPLYRDEYVHHQGLFKHMHSDDDGHFTINVNGHAIETLEPSQVVVVGVILLYLTIGLLHLFGRLTRWATKFFTCEYFATSGVVHLYSTLPQYMPLAQQAPTYVYSGQ